MPRIECSYCCNTCVGLSPKYKRLSTRAESRCCEKHGPLSHTFFALASKCVRSRQAPVNRQLRHRNKSAKLSYLLVEAYIQSSKLLVQVVRLINNLLWLWHRLSDANVIGDWLSNLPF